ncbi:TonB C-terminal domain-containing protein [Desulfobacter curvatus]|uniref:TonB C-terminal domain-containing protein n=1 Tax=Desulfobacter curvatus TaxID=2290 RepID=UPI0003739369|nr:TonB C-terminal domain-containing protein [Desulfobacter curvatus]
MSDAHLKVCCLLLSCFIHWILLGLSFSPALSPYGNIELTPFNISRGAPCVKPSFALQQLVEQTVDSNDPDADGQSGENHRKQILSLYLKQVKEEINRCKFLSEDMDKEQMNQLIGNAQYAFSIDAAGKFYGIHITRSSGNALIDKASKSAIVLAGQRVKRPEETGTAPISLELAIKFQYGL